MFLTGKVQANYMPSAQSWTWIGSIHGLDWIGLGPMTAILCFFHLYIFYINN